MVTSQFVVEKRKLSFDGMEKDFVINENKPHAKIYKNLMF